MPSSHTRCYQAYQGNIHILIERWPDLFCRENPIPLAIDIFEQIIATPDLGMDDETLEYCLAVWTQRREYCRAMVQFGYRANLRNGQGTVAIDEETMRVQRERLARFQRRGMLPE